MLIGTRTSMRAPRQSTRGRGLGLSRAFPAKQALNRRVFDAEIVDSRYTGPPSIAEVSQALYVTSTMPCLDERVAYCTSKGVDYAMALRYFDAVVGLERALPAGGCFCLCICLETVWERVCGILQYVFWCLHFVVAVMIDD